MGNTYKIIWSDEALKNLKDIIDYLENRWSKKEISRFAGLLDKNIELIKGNPLIFPRSISRQDYRKSVISKQISLYYEIHKQTVTIITLWDNRQSPRKFKKGKHAP
jgi:plasmid stabilization system protein ParE